MIQPSDDAYGWLRPPPPGPALHLVTPNMPPPPPPRLQGTRDSFRGSEAEAAGSEVTSAVTRVSPVKKDPETKPAGEDPETKPAGGDASEGTDEYILYIQINTASLISIS